jgi:hypothetical protein
MAAARRSSRPFVLAALRALRLDSLLIDGERLGDGRTTLVRILTMAAPPASPAPPNNPR